MAVADGGAGKCREDQQGTEADGNGLSGEGDNETSLTAEAEGGSCGHNSDRTRYVPEAEGAEGAQAEVRQKGMSRGQGEADEANEEIGVAPKRETGVETGDDVEEAENEVGSHEATSVGTAMAIVEADGMGLGMCGEGPVDADGLLVPKSLEPVEEGVSLGVGRKFLRREVGGIWRALRARIHFPLHIHCFFC